MALAALVLGKWTFGASTPALIVLLFVTALLSIASFHLIEDPLRRASWLPDGGLTIAAAAALLMPVFYLIHSDVPARASSNNDNLAQIFGVPTVGEFPDVPCHGRVKVQALPDPLHSCLSAVRTADKPHVLTLLGDSHAAQLYPMAIDATRDLPFSVRFINPEDNSDFPFNLLAGAKSSKILDVVTANLRPGDIVAIAFHRGHFNADRDKHVPITADATPNKKSRGFVAGMTPYLETWIARGAAVVLVNDTPLMNVVSASSSCLLQTRLFGQSICRVTKVQDLHTRKRQDAAFAELATASRGVRTWDPAELIYKGRTEFDVADADGRYLMWDWNHISEHQSRLLAPSFRDLLNERRGSP